MKFSNGNMKIGRDTLILNMTSASECPSKVRGLCKIPGICYAMKAERQYPNVRPFRDKQCADFTRQSAGDIAKDILDIAMRKRKNKIKYVRFSEAGDFRDQSDVDKLSDIAEALRPYGIRFYGYTARRDLNFDNISDNMIVNGSGFRVHNNFEAVPEAGPDDVICPGNCRTCDLCKNAGGRDIKVIYH